MDGCAPDCEGIRHESCCTSSRRGRGTSGSGKTSVLAHRKTLQGGKDQKSEGEEQRLYNKKTEEEITEEMIWDVP